MLQRGGVIWLAFEGKNESDINQRRNFCVYHVEELWYQETNINRSGLRYVCGLRENRAGLKDTTEATYAVGLWNNSKGLCDETTYIIHQVPSYGEFTSFNFERK